jgi:hypothetical protein
MPTTVFQVDRDSLDAVRGAIMSFGDRKDLEPTSQHEFFRCLLHEHTVIVYTTGKVVVSGKTPENIVLIIQNMLKKTSRSIT